MMRWNGFGVGFLQSHNAGLLAADVELLLCRAVRPGSSGVRKDVGSAGLSLSDRYACRMQKIVMLCKEWSSMFGRLRL